MPFDRLMLTGKDSSKIGSGAPVMQPTAIQADSGQHQLQHARRGYCYLLLCLLACQVRTHWNDELCRTSNLELPWQDHVWKTSSTQFYLLQQL